MHVAGDTTGELSCYMKQYQTYLKGRYECFPFKKLDCFSTQYVDLTLIKEKGDNDLHSMFQKDEKYANVTLAKALDVEAQQKKVILMLGGPGMGKSTLAVYICKQWAKGDLLQSYNVVLLLLLRNAKIQKANNIKDLLLTLDDDIKEIVFKEIVKSNGEKSVFSLKVTMNCLTIYRRIHYLLN